VTVDVIAVKLANNVFNITFNPVGAWGTPHVKYVAETGYVLLVLKVLEYCKDIVRVDPALKP